MDNEMQQVVLASLRSLVPPEAGAGLGVDTTLKGAIDSFQLIRLVSVLEKKFKIKFKPLDLREEDDWASVAQISALVMRIQARAAPRS